MQMQRVEQGRAEQGRETAISFWKTLSFWMKARSAAVVHGNEGLLEQEKRPIQKSKYSAQKYIDSAQDQVGYRKSVCRSPCIFAQPGSVFFLGRTEDAKKNIFRYT